MKKSKRKAKRPVLTSPWKIGIFVSLLLVLTSLGVGYYFVSFYKVDLKWIKSGAAGWTVDSMLFMNDMLPLAVAVILVSLLAYLLIASAVHRYKFYLDSGQDYRTMISLAESIDDLTNPAQIARLSQYPELQAVLRSYGDQIREISRDLGTQDTASSYSELKSEIESLIGEECGDESTVASMESGSLIEELRSRIEKDRMRIEELEKRLEEERRAFAQAALAHGRAVEAISGVGEELLAMTNFVTELTSVAERISAQAVPQGDAASRESDAGEREKALRATMSEMEASVRRLEENGRALHEFSEENNGIAIHLALMAARGNIDEHALATFAERVRSTAERFHKLSGSASSIAQGLLDNCYALKEHFGISDEGAPHAVDAEISGAIVEIASRIEEKNADLEKRIMSLGSELHDVHELLQRDMQGGSRANTTGSGMPQRGSAGTGATREDGAASVEMERIASAAGSHDSSDMVIDHGSSWQGISPREETGEATDTGSSEEDGFSFKNLDEMKTALAQASPARGKKHAAADFSNITSLKKLDSEDDAAPEDAAAPEAERMQSAQPEGHVDPDKADRRWRKVEVEKTEIEEEAGQVDVRVAAAPPESPQREAEPVFETVEEAALGSEKTDDEPVYDLFDLGAVEYAKESQLQR